MKKGEYVPDTQATMLSLLVAHVAPDSHVHGAARRLSVIPFRDVKPCACEWSQAHRTSRGTIHTFPRFPKCLTTPASASEEARRRRTQREPSLLLP